jgi:hypothetical protein
MGTEVRDVPVVGTSRGQLPSHLVRALQRSVCPGERPVEADRLPAGGLRLRVAAPPSPRAGIRLGKGARPNRGVR